MKSQTADKQVTPFVMKHPQQHCCCCLSQLPPASTIAPCNPAGAAAGQDAVGTACCVPTSHGAMQAGSWGLTEWGGSP
jgi:hypothetical protein